MLLTHRLICFGARCMAQFSARSKTLIKTKPPNAMNKPAPTEYTRTGNQIIGMHGKTAKRLAAAGMLILGKHAHQLTPKGVAWFDLAPRKRFKWNDDTNTAPGATPAQIAKECETGDIRQGFVMASLNPRSPLDVLKRILAAHDSKNNGAVMGEAVLCREFAESARAAIANATGKGKA
jgi:hypothetical protein